MNDLRIRRVSVSSPRFFAAILKLIVAPGLIVAVMLSPDAAREARAGVEPCAAAACEAADGAQMIQALNQPPVANDDVAETLQDVSVLIAVLANDVDLDGNLEPETTDVISQAANGAAAVNADGTVLYTPDNTFIGVDSFVYEVCDSEGLCDSATVQVTVRAANAPPAAADDSAATAENTPVTIAVLENDTDPDGDILDLVSTTEPSGGTATRDDSGTVTYTPDPAFCGTDSFTYVIADGAGGTDTATVTISVQCAPSGFVTGGGWIVSPEGSCQLTTACQGTTGRSNFGFVSKYRKNASVPKGSTQFRFQAGGINFHSEEQMTLRVSGSRAQFAGSGTINRDGDYGMIVTMIDGKLDGTRVDKLRIKIWDKTTGAVVYDNQMGAPDSADPTMPLGGGSIMIHKSK